ncbi:MAG: SURF1 family protein, partial [Rhizobiales bacterium]|nr:SURF1 family protein [Rhizobacter sp.]
PLAPLSVLQADSPSTAGDGLLRDWPHPAVDVQKHYGYAFQWFALGALMAGLYVWFQLVRPRLRARNVGA